MLLFVPQAIWNNKMREELLGLMEAQRAAPQQAQHAQQAQQAPAAGFAYSSLKGELVLAGVSAGPGPASLPAATRPFM